MSTPFHKSRDGRWSSIRKHDFRPPSPISLSASGFSASNESFASSSDATHPHPSSLTSVALAMVDLKNEDNTNALSQCGQLPHPPRGRGSKASGRAMSTTLRSSTLVFSLFRLHLGLLGLVSRTFFKPPNLATTFTAGGPRLSSPFLRLALVHRLQPPAPLLAPLSSALCYLARDQLSPTTPGLVSSRVLSLFLSWRVYVAALSVSSHRSFCPKHTPHSQTSQPVVLVSVLSLNVRASIPDPNQPVPPDRDVREPCPSLSP
ncbi:hypothetical protein V8E36_009265 [Tilletia maclaganii]